VLSAVLVVALAGVASGGSWLWTSHRVKQADASLTAQRTAARIALVRADAATVATWLSTAVGQVARLSGQLSPWTGSGAQLSSAPQVLDRGLAGADELDHGVLVTDRAGVVVAADSADAILVGLVRSYGAPPPALGAVSLATDNLQHSTDVVIRVAVPGPAGGAVVIGRSMLASGGLGRAVARLVGAPGSTLAVLDPAGDDINVTGGAAPTLGLPPEPQYAAAMAGSGAGGPGLADLSGEGSTRLAVAYSPAGWGWTVVVSQPLGVWAQPADSPWRALAFPMGAILLVLVVLVLLLELDRPRLDRKIEVAKRSFLTIAGHELRTPLTTIRGFSQLLTSAGGRLPEAQRRELIDSIGQQAQVLEHLVERLLTGAQLEAGVAPSVARQPVGLNRHLERAVEHHQALSPIHQIELHAEEGLTVIGDADALDQVLGHVIENAVKYSPAGGPVEVRAWRRGRRVEVSVSDQGVGLPAGRWRNSRRIFEMLAQSESPEARVHDEGGVGMGLFISSQLLARMGGAIRAVPNRPVGAEFRIRLAAAPTR